MKAIVSMVLLLLSACATQKVQPARTKQPPDFDECMREGSVFLGGGDYDRAVKQFGEAAALNDQAPKAHNFLGMAYFQEKEYALAEQHFLRALTLDPSFASACNNLGSVYFVRHEYQKAKDMLTRALGLAPDLVAANYGMGSVLIALGDLEGGAGYLSRGIALDPNYLDTHGALVTSVSSASFGERGIGFIYAKFLAAAGNVEKTVEYLSRAKKAGFREWQRISTEKEFDKVRQDPRIQAFLKP